MLESLYQKDKVISMKKNLKKLLSGILSCSMVLGAFCGVGPAVTYAAEVPVPAYRWDFESVTDGTVENTGDADGGVALVQGTAAVEAEQITINGKTYTAQDNHVLNLKGGSNGSSYVDLPSDLYQGVNADTGFTWSF